MSELEPNRVEPDEGESAALLQRILTVVEGDKRRGRLEVVLAIVMSLATLASTWCGYQATLWGGMESRKSSAADIAGRKAAEDAIEALQIRTYDGIEVLVYWNELRQKDTESAETILLRMKPPLRAAVEASVAAGILHDPTVVGPLHRPEYVLPEERSAERLRKEEARLNGEADAADQAGGAYVTLTLIFASVLFFGGIAGTFTSRRVRSGMGGVSLVLFVLAIVMLAGLPVCPS